MGLLSLGTPLSWPETKRYADHVRKHGILQFIHIYNNQRYRENDCFKWGDEVEYTLLKLDHEKKKVYCNLKAKEILDVLHLEEMESPSTIETAWRAELTNYMVEGIPGKPMGGCIKDIGKIEANMALRRQEIQKNLTEPGETVQTIVAFPRLGCPRFTYPSFDPSPGRGLSRSMFYPDEAIYQGHPKFTLLTENITERRGSKVAVNVPIFKDVNTPSPFVEKFPVVEGEGPGAAKPDHIYLDAVGFGGGMCCLQVTLQASSITEARYLYDQLAVIAPIVLALSASTPIVRGYLSNMDCRWGILSSAMDDRTPEEKGLEPLKENRFIIPKSRYDSISTFLSPEANTYSDIDLVHDKEIYQLLVDAGVDEQLARHYAHLFIRDPVFLFREHIHEDDETNSNLFENIQSTNWQTVRFKPPPPNTSIGWRVEFRPTEVQLTDFENAAYVAFIVLLARAILSFDLNLLVPLSKVDENMITAQHRDAARRGKFYFRKNLTKSNKNTQTCDTNYEDEYELMTINEIMNGKEGEFTGLIPLIESYLSNVDLETDTYYTISEYLTLIKRKASGELLTTAQWIRRFVDIHPDYKKDSVVNETICYDLINTFDRIALGDVEAPELLGKPTSKESNYRLRKYQETKREITKIVQ